MNSTAIMQKVEIFQSLAVGLPTALFGTAMSFAGMMEWVGTLGTIFGFLVSFMMFIINFKPMLNAVRSWFKGDPKKVRKTKKR